METYHVLVMITAQSWSLMERDRKSRRREVEVQGQPATWVWGVNHISEALKTSLKTVN